MTPKKKIKFDIKFASDSFTIKPEIEYYGNKILCFVNFIYFILWSLFRIQKTTIKKYSFYELFFAFRSIGFFTDNPIWKYIWNISYIYPWIITGTKKQRIFFTIYYLFFTYIKYKTDYFQIIRFFYFPVFFGWILYKKLFIWKSYELILLLCGISIHFIIMLILTFLSGEANSLFVYSNVLFVDTLIIYPWLILLFEKGF